MSDRSTPIRVFLVDDHRIVSDGLQALLATDESISCVGSATNGADALEMMQHLRIDVALVDIDMPVMDGIALTEQLKRDRPELRVIILSIYDEAALVQRVMDLGADGYLVKNCGRDELFLAIRDVHAGRRHFGSALLESMLEQRQRTAMNSGLLKDMSEREVEVLAALAEGLTNKEIGDRLFISPRTVDSHRTNLMKKLETHNVAGLVRIAIKAGLVK